MDTERRRFLRVMGAAAILGPGGSYAQEVPGTPTIGFLMGLGNDLEAKARIAAFERGLEKHGLFPGRNVRVEYRFAAGDAGLMRTYARELVALRPAVIVGHSSPVVTHLVQATRTIPIVFVVVADPVGSGFAASIPNPGGNVTGFTNVAATITGKLLTILKQITPNLNRVALLFSPDASINAGLLFLHPLEVAAPSLGVKVVRAPARQAADIERAMTELAREPNVGLIVMPDNFTTIHRDLIISLAAKLRLPTVYPYRFFTDAGGLMSYGVDVKDLFRRAPEYVSRIMRGERPADLPIQAPTQFELVINLKTARTLGLELPKILLAGADATIE